MSKKILYFITEDWYFWTHRRDLALASKRNGYDVILVTQIHEHQERIIDLGIKVIPIKIRRSSLNPVKELNTFISLIKIIRDQKPDIIHNIALKPVIYGTWAGKICGVKGIVNTFGGLGHLFTSQKWTLRFSKSILSTVFKLTFWGKHIRIIVQNARDLQEIIQRKIAKKDKVALVRGAGADLDIFHYQKEKRSIPVILYGGRLLWSKGVGDLVEAVNLINKQNQQCQLVLAGRPDPENPKSIPEEIIKEWLGEGSVEWVGFRDDMHDVIASSSIVALPSCYGEGVPKILIEAAAVGRPIVATDIPGCSEIVIDNENGFLVPCRDTEKLAEVLIKLIEDPDLRERMGKTGRKLVEGGFSKKIINQEVLNLYGELE